MEVIRGENETAKLEEEVVVVVIIIGFFIFMETLLLLLQDEQQEMGDGAAAGVVVINGDVVIPIPLFFNDSSEWSEVYYFVCLFCVFSLSTSTRC